MSDIVILDGVTPVNAEVMGLSPSSRAVEVREELVKIKNDMEDGFLDLCYLLYEAQAGDYHTFWGYNRFDDWVEQGSGLDISARQAFNYLNIARKAHKMQMTKADLKNVGISKLKEIFSLDPAQHEQEIRKLLKEADKADLVAIKNQVHQTKNPAAPAPSYVTLKLDFDVKVSFDLACERAKQIYGETMQDGQVSDISTSRCVEMICQSYLQDPNNQATGGGISPVV